MPLKCNFSAINTLLLCHSIKQELLHATNMPLSRYYDAIYMQSQCH